MSVKIINGNIFTSKCQTIVNTINCVGVMGAGIALEFRLRYPEMYKKYVNLCNEKKIAPGMLWLYKSPKKWVLNFPTKNDWKDPSEEEYLHKGLEKFIATYKVKNIQSIAFPLLGADKGKIDSETSLSIINFYLKNIDIETEIYIYNPSAEDDLYGEFKKFLASQSIKILSESINIKTHYLEKIISSIERDEVKQINQLLKTKGVGVKTLEKIFLFMKESNNIGNKNLWE